MKNSVKIALGIVAGGVLVLLNQKRKNRKNTNQTFTAPDGKEYQQNQMYRTADGQVYRNGKKLRVGTPDAFSQNQNHIDSSVNNQNLNDNHLNSTNHTPSYHHKGTRHR